MNNIEVRNFGRGLLAVLFGAILFSHCAESAFTGTNKKGQPKPVEDDVTKDPTPASPSPTPSPNPEVPPEISSGDGSTLIKLLDYDACKALPSNGKQGYGKCALNSAVVIVNDGAKAEMTCCPVAGSDLFSTVASELHVAKNGVCGTNELLTGMRGINSNLYCSKINTQLYKLSSPVPSKYIGGSEPGIMGQIAASYNNSDTCICPEGTIAIGGHSPTNNECIEQCVKVERK